MHVPAEATRTAGGAGLSATKPTDAIVTFDSGRLHARQAQEPAKRNGAATTHAPAPAETARAAAVLTSQRPPTQQPRQAGWEMLNTAAVQARMQAAHDEYAAHQKVKRVYDIIGDQMQAARDECAPLALCAPP